MKRRRGTRGVQENGELFEGSRQKVVTKEEVLDEEWFTSAKNRS